MTNDLPGADGGGQPHPGRDGAIAKIAHVLAAVDEVQHTPAATRPDAPPAATATNASTGAPSTQNIG